MRQAHDYWISAVFSVIVCNSGCGTPMTPTGASNAGADADSQDNKVPANRFNHSGAGLTGQNTSSHRLMINVYNGAQIKNLLIFQVGGWTGLTNAAAAGTFDPEWPLIGLGQPGPQTYLSRNLGTVGEQLQWVGALGGSVAVQVLLMNDDDSYASGYGTCWNGVWNGQLDGNGKPGNVSCSGGTWRTPEAMYADTLYAAWVNGVPAIPNLSIMNYRYCAPDQNGNCTLPDPGSHVLAQLQDALSVVRNNLGSVSVRTADGLLVVEADGLPTLSMLTPNERQQLLDWMQSQSDIFWIDNLALDNGNPGPYLGSNVYREGMWCNAVTDPNNQTQASMSQVWGDHYLWFFCANDTVTHYSQFIDATYKFTTPVREQMLNIIPNDPNAYPVVIAQWNEYGEYHIFEPSTYSQFNNYYYLKWMLSQQPPSGSYAESCSGCTTNTPGTTMRCDCCYDGQGQCRAAAIDFSTCAKGMLWNNDGQLTCY